MASFLHRNKSVPLPMEFINKYMINANATYVKVYLYGLAKCYEGEEDISNASIAEALDILETDVSKAWRYWKRVGLVHSEGKGVLVFSDFPDTGEKEQDVASQPPKEKSEEKSKAVSMKDIERAMSVNPSVKETVAMAEQLLKKSLSQREVTAIYGFMQEYSMTQEMVIVLLEYCATMDKTNFSYIEKVAQGWYENGIRTLEDATKVLNKLLKEARMQKKCKKLFGLDRELSQTEQGYIARWVSELSMSETMIKTAYERTVANTGKISMPYMNTILKSWYEKGIKTVAQIAEKEGNPSQKGKTARSKSYELDDMAAIERKRRLQKQKQ